MHCSVFQVAKAFSQNIVSKSNCVHVGRIPGNWKMSNLLESFAIFGPVMSMKMMLNSEGTIGAPFSI